MEEQFRKQGGAREVRTKKQRSEQKGRKKGEEKGGTRTANDQTTHFGIELCLHRWPRLRASYSKNVVLLHPRRQKTIPIRLKHGLDVPKKPFLAIQAHS